MAPDPSTDAHKAREQARAGFLAAVDMGSEVREATARLRAHHDRNHWGEGLERAMQLRGNSAS